MSNLLVTNGDPIIVTREAGAPHRPHGAARGESGARRCVGESLLRPAQR